MVLWRPWAVLEEKKEHKFYVYGAGRWEKQEHRGSKGNIVQGH